MNTENTHPAPPSVTYGPALWWEDLPACVQQIPLQTGDEQLAVTIKPEAPYCDWKTTACQPIASRRHDVITKRKSSVNAERGIVQNVSPV